MKNVRMSIVMPLEDKAEILALAAKLGIPVAELIRRAVECYEPNSDDAILLHVAEELEERTQRTGRNLDGAIEAVKGTVAYLQQSRGERQQ